MKRAKFKIGKENTGKIVVSIQKGTKTIELDLNECCILGDKIDIHLFGSVKTTRRSRVKIRKMDLSPMSKEEMHDVLYDFSYLDGTHFSKAMSVKLIKMVDEGDLKTYEDLFNMYGRILSNKKTIKRQ